MTLDHRRVRAITLDLDDTLWPVGPAIVHAEHTLTSWFSAHAPRVLERFDAAARRAVRDSVTRDKPEWAHDLSAQRLETIRRLLAGSGEDQALADAAFETFLAARQHVSLYPDVAPALARLAARWPLLAVTNGNADVMRIGLGQWIGGTVSARDAGHAKPDPRIFAAACARLGCAPQTVLHVGDDLALDARAAHAAGLQAALVVRGEPVAERDAVPAWVGPDLLALADHLAA